MKADKQQVPKNNGQNPPISTAAPSAHELRNNEEMELYLTQNSNIYESEEGQIKRKLVIEKINRILQEWATEVGTDKNILPQFLVKGGGIHIRIFGSTRLNVHNADSDIDTLCIAPSFISRVDFFTSFCDKLQNRLDVESLTAIAEAYTPVIKFTIDGQSVDMVFASVSPDVENKSPMIPKNFHISDIKCLQGLDDQSVRSINGARVAERICDVIPHMDTFCSALRIIKYWARQRGLYSNVLGFLGGVNYAILVAFLCQLYTKACTFTVVQKFFNVLSMWRWPNPILISAFEDLKLKDAGGRFLPVWNPRANYKDSLHIMPIITPAYPAMNSAYNVSTPQFRCIQDEIMRGNNMFQTHSLSSGAVFDWERLLEPCTAEFFTRFPRYIQVTISATTMLDHRNWYGWVESRLRMLIVSLEQPPVVFSHPMANCIHRQPSDVMQESTSIPVVTTSSEDSIGNNVMSSPNATRRTESEIDLENFTLASNKKPSVPVEGECENGEGSLSRITTARESVLNTPIKAAPTLSPSPAPETWNSSFFIGLSFGQNVNYEDVTPAILDFSQRVSTWGSKKPTMDLQISSFDHQHIPAFIFHVPAEPSNVKSCTKAVKKNSAHPAALNILSVVGSGKINRVPSSEHKNGAVEDESEAYLHSRLLSGNSAQSESTHPEHIARRMSVDMEVNSNGSSFNGTYSSMGSRKMSVDEGVFTQSFSTESTLGGSNAPCSTSKVLFAEGDGQVGPQGSYFQALQKQQQPPMPFPQQMPPMFQQQRVMFPPPQQYMAPFTRQGVAPLTSLPPGVPPPPGMMVNPAMMFQNGTGIPFVNGQAPFGIAQGVPAGFPPLPGVPVYHAYAGQNVDQFMQQQQLQNVSPGVTVNGTNMSSAYSEDNKRVLSPDANQAQQQGFYSSPPSSAVSSSNGGLFYANGVAPTAGGLVAGQVGAGVDPLLIYSSPPKRLRKDSSPQQQGQGQKDEQEEEEAEAEVEGRKEGNHVNGHNNHHTSHHHNNNHHQNHQNHQHNNNHGRGSSHGEKPI